MSIFKCTQFNVMLNIHRDWNMSACVFVCLDQRERWQRRENCVQEWGKKRVIIYAIHWCNSQSKPKNKEAKSTNSETNTILNETTPDKYPSLCGHFHQCHTLYSMPCFCVCSKWELSPISDSSHAWWNHLKGAHFRSHCSRHLHRQSHSHRVGSL